MSASVSDLSRGIAETVGVFRAEYLTGAEFFRLMERPDYWAQLEGRRACFLVGGRGTGKTTALRALAFEGQAARHGTDATGWDAIGFYWRVDTSVVTAFRGSRLDDEEWQRLFAHFVNLRLTRSVLDFVRWHDAQGHPPIDASESFLGLAAAALGVEAAPDLSSFGDALSLASERFEARVNSGGDEGSGMTLSILGAPLRHLLAAIRADERYARHYFTFAIDEYENLAPYQQRVVNTLIKHAGDGEYTFKVGVKEKGVVDRSTLHPSEYLSEPADYKTVHVEQSLKEQGFDEFAARVVNDRLGEVTGTTVAEVKELFPELSDEAEAELLGGQRRRVEVRLELEAEGAAPDEIEAFDQMTVLSACMVGYWAQSKKLSLRDVLRDSLAEPDQWKNRLNNYGFAMLYTLRNRVSGIRKLYAGWSVLTRMADGNIRHLLALVAEALTRHVVSGNDLATPVSAQLQTLAAEQVGERAVFELAGLHARGSEMMRLALSLGRVFGVMAADPYGHTPEVTQIRVDRTGLTDNASLDDLLSASVMHSAVIGFPGDKNSARSGDTKEHDYELHPIFSAFFVYSYRSKRRISVAGHDVLALASATPQGTVAKILRRNARNPSSDLPPQLELLTEFFDDAH